MSMRWNDECVDLSESRLLIYFNRLLIWLWSKLVVGSSNANILQLLVNASLNAILITIDANNFYPVLLLPFISIYYPFYIIIYIIYFYNLLSF